MTDFSCCYRLYRDILGLTFLDGDENGPYASFSVDGPEIALFTRVGMAEAVGTSPSPTLADAKDKAALIIGAPDVDGAYNGLLSRGGVFVDVPFDQQ